VKLLLSQTLSSYPSGGISRGLSKHLIVCCRIRSAILRLTDCMMITLVQFKKPLFLKRLSSFGAACRIPKLTPTEQHTQLSICKRATVFVDACDDLETKIGCLSRRLNFLMMEADLWRDKFATFEQYAERLSADAGQLHSRIGKEQTRQHLSDLVHLIAAEKVKLQTHKHRLRTPHSNTNNAL